ncbi:arf-GAP with Rho-GAP domain, ANK repeat and PH domain-containing protein 1-like [Pseudochaenichthys georgianus]|uniref:arf-GAP with Rho-GAP domain, ANK repeat and PH domain-containing protein 1-like n=1 Tax=Pseudochaenichthys georgianus TaxID=52239 RepID=UPI00146D2CE7|nr:pollen-specific leucine-rich repeat extensin-like protein 1 [Pseudochaenichthys georgianus]
MLHSHTPVMSESCLTVWDWLSVLRLEQYSEAFRSAGLASFQQCRNLTSETLDQMGITLPGHQRRILASLNKTHAKSDAQFDTYSYIVSLERDRRPEETEPPKVLQRERPVPIPVEDTPVPKERELRDGETSRPTPRERNKPVPRERQVHRMKEESGEAEEKKPVPEQRQTAPREGKEEERDGGGDRESWRPVPKERTRFRSSAPDDCDPSQVISPTADPSLPPVPPRSTPNCPPQCFSSPLSPSSAAQTPVSPKLDRHAVKTPTVQSKSVFHSSPTHAPLPLPPAETPSARTRPQTLDIQPPAHHLGSDGGRKTSPEFPTAPQSDGISAPPLPPKVGVVPKGPPPIPQRLPAHSPRTHR